MNVVTRTGQPLPAHAAFRPDIEGLRAVAVSLVIASHLLGWPSGGFVGVDVFFVLSGFLITGLLVTEIERTGRISFAGFYARRARRLLPAAVLVLVVTVVAARVLFLAERAQQTALDALWSLVFLSNVHVAGLGTNYFEANRPPSPLQHYWSLAVEEQFYVLWPVLLLLLHAVARRTRSPRRTLTAGTGLLVVASFGWCLHLTASAPTEAYFSTTARAWELGLGALVALQAPAVAALGPRVRGLLSGCGVAGILLAVVLIGPTTAFPGWAAALPVLATVAVLLGGGPRWSPAGSWGLAHPVPRYVGRISYSLYLWHWPVIVLTGAVLPVGSAQARLVAAVATAALAVAAYHLVELPVRRSTWLSPDAAPGPTRRPAGPRRHPATAGVLVLGVLVLTVLVVPAVGMRDVPSPDVLAGGGGVEAVPAGLDGRGIEQAVRDALGARSWPTDADPALESIGSAGAPEWFEDECVDIAPDNLQRCTYGPADAPRHAVVLGDSFGTSWLPGLRAALLPAGYDITPLTLGQCPNTDVPVTRDGVPHDKCDRQRPWALEQVKKMQPDLVVLADAYTVWGGLPGVDDADKARVVRDGLTRQLLQLKKAATRVVVLETPPGGGNLQGCATRFNGPRDCQQGPDPRWLPFATAERAAAQAAGVPYVGTAAWFCSSGECPPVVDRTPVYWDGRHLTARYSERLGTALALGIRP